MKSFEQSILHDWYEIMTNDLPRAIRVMSCVKHECDDVDEIMNF